MLPKTFSLLKICKIFQPLLLSLVRSFCFLLLILPSHIFIQCYKNVNPTNFPLLNEEQLHDYIAATQTLTILHPGVDEIPLIDADLILFADGSYLCISEGVFRQDMPLQISKILQKEASTQHKNQLKQQNMWLLQEPALKLKIGELMSTERVDMLLEQYIHLVHTQKAKRFMTATRTIKNGKQVIDLLKALLLPQGMIILNTNAHRIIKHLRQGETYQLIICKLAVYTSVPIPLQSDKILFIPLTT